MTVFELLDGLSTGDVTAAVDGQAGQLASVITLVTNLAENPPDGITSVLSTIQDIGLPDISLGDELPSTLTQLQGALPTDLSSVTGALTGTIGDLGETVGGELVDAVQQGLGPILDIAKLFALDFTCEHEDKSRDLPKTKGPGDPNGFIATIDQASGILAAVPTPLTVDTVLTLLAHVLDGPLASAIPIPIPFLDSLREPLITVVRWRGMQPDAIAAEMAGTIGHLVDLLDDCTGSTIDALTGDLAQLPQDARTTDLANIADSLVQALTTIAAAIESGDLSTTAPTVAAANTTADQLDAIRAPRATGDPDQWHILLDRIRALPGEIDDKVAAVESLLGAPAPFPPVDAFSAFDADAALASIPDSVGQAIDQAIAPALGWLQELVGKLDLSAVQQPIEQVAITVQNAVDQVEQGLASVTTEVQALFGQVQDLIDGVDIQGLVDGVKSEVTDFCNQLTQQLQDLFAPVKDVISQVITQVSSAVDGFDPATVVDGLKNVVQGITDVLSSPDVTNAINQIKGALDAVAEELKGLSFEPVTDQVVGVIDEITTALKALDPATLSPALSAALNGAVALLPQDLSGVTDPLVEEFGQLVDQGPAQLIEAAKDPVDRLLAKVRDFEPAGLIGNNLDGPFQDLITTLEGFKPSNLLKAIDDQLGELKGTLEQAVDPARLLAPLQTGFDDLLNQFDSLEPSTLVEPINDALQGVVQQALDAVPIDDLLAPVTDVLSRIQAYADAGTKAVGLLDTVKGLLDATQELPTQVDTWVDEVANTVGGLADTQAIDAAMTQLAHAADGLHATQLTARIDEVLNPALTAVDDLDAQRRLTDMVDAYRSVSTRKLDTLPDSPEKQAVKDLLARVNPTKRPFSEPFDALAQLKDRLHDAREAIAEAFADWDNRHVASGAVLAGLAAVDATAADLRTWISDTLKANVVPPVRMLLSTVAPLTTFIEPLQTHLNALVTELTSKLTALLTGEGSVGAITGAIDRLLDDLRNVDLSFLTDALDSVFADIRSKFSALSPGELAQPIENAFDAALDTLSIGSVLSDADRQELDDDFQKIVDKLNTLSPKALIIDVVQPEFDEKVRPMLDAFDVAALLQALLDGLHGLEDDLRSDLGDVNDAYKAMLAAVPPFDPLALAGSLGDVAGTVGDAVGDAVGGLF